MLSKNNFKERLRKMEPKKERFSIRKFTIGAASVLIGFAIFGMTSQSVSADELNNQNGKLDGADAAEEAKTPKTPVTSNVKSKDASKVVVNKGTASETKADEETDKNTNKVNVTELVKNADANAAALKENKITATETVKENKNTDTNNQVDKKSAQIRKSVVPPKELQQKIANKYHRLAPATATQTETVENWEQLANALNNNQVGTINITGDITVNNNTSNAITKPNPLVAPGKLQLTGKDISRTVTINGNNHTIDFGDNYINFTIDGTTGLVKGNRDKDHPWNITFNDATINSNVGVPFGLVGNSHASGDNQYDTVTYNNVKVNIKKSALIDSSNVNVVFTGDNTINTDDVGASATITANTVNVVNGTTTINNATSIEANTFGGQAVGRNTIWVSPQDAGKDSVNIAEGATLNINAKSVDLRGIVTSDFKTGTITVNGTLNEDMQNGHSSAILAGNLNIGKKGTIKITTKQDNEADGIQNAWTNGVADYNGFHYGVIALGTGQVGPGAIGNGERNLIDNGSLTIIRKDVPTDNKADGNVWAPLISFGAGADNEIAKGNFTFKVGEGATLDLQDEATFQKPMKNLGNYPNTPVVGLINMFGMAASDNLSFTKPAYVNLQRNGKQTGTLIRLEGTNSNIIQLNGVTPGGTPLSQWDEGNYTNNPSSTWRIVDLTAHSASGNDAIKGFENKAGNGMSRTFLGSNGSVTLSMDKKGNVVYTRNSNGEVVNDPNGTAAEEVELNNFLNNFNFWTPQRISFGSKATIKKPAYSPSTAPQGKTTTVSPAFPRNNSESATDDQMNVTYTTATDTPAWVSVDENTGVLTLKPTTDNSHVGMYNVPIVVINTDETNSGKTSKNTVFAPVYVTDGNEQVNWGKDKDGNYTGAVVVTTDPAALKAHETTDNSSVFNAGDAVKKIEEYQMDTDTTVDTTPTEIAKDAQGVSIAWAENGVPSTVVPTATGSENIDGKVNVKFDTNSQPFTDKVLGQDTDTPVPYTSTSDIKIPTAGATAKNVTTPVTVDAGSTTLSQENFNKLIDHSVLDNAGITGYTYAWKTAPKAGDTSGVVRITFTDKDAQGNNTYLDIPTSANSITVHTNQTDADKYQPSYGHINVNKGETKSEDPTWTNNETAPEGTKFEKGTGTNVPDWATVDNNGKVTVTPGTNVTPGDYTIPVKVTYPDTTSETVNVPVTVTNSTPDTDKYQPNYNPISVKPGQTNSETPTWENNQTAPEGTKFEKGTGTNVPDWATVDQSTGKVTVAPGTKVTPGDYTIPVTVTYPDNTKETVNVPVVVTGSKQDDNTVTVYSPQSTISYTMNTYNTHKTSDSSSMPTVAAPTVQTIVYKNQDKKWNVLSSITYELQGNKYVAVDANGNKLTSTNVQIFGSQAPLEFDASGVTTAWQEGFGINTSVSNYGGSTGTSTAQSQYGNPNGDQRTTSGDLAGNSKTRVTLSLSGQAADILHNSVADWSNVFGNIYGATTGSTETFKQGQDISGLSQDEFRKLINVTDLGQDGWNGQNINPNAPQVLAYIQGTDSSKKFAMEWAPGHEPSTATVANGVSGMVRILFNDGTYLDVPAKINVEADSNNNKPDDQKTSFTQKIVYQYNGQQVASTEITDIAKNSSLTAEQLKNKIDANIPANYSIADGYTYPAAENNITKTPADIIVPLKQSEQQNHDSDYNAQYTISYKDAKTGDALKTKNNKDNVEFKFNTNDGLSAATIKAGIDNNIPTGWKIADGFTYPTAQTKTGSVVVPLVHATKDIKPTDPTVNPTDPKYKAMFSDPTRTINVHETNESSPITHTEKQTVWFGREGVLDEVTGKVTAKEGAEWKLGKLDNGKFVEDAHATDSWASYTAPTKQGYTAVGSPVAAKDGITADTNNVTIDITYTDGQPFNFDPTNKDEVKDVIRTITIYKTDGHSATVTQTVHFVRGGTGKVAGYTNHDGSITWTPWTVAKTVNGDPNVSTGATTGSWEEYDVPQVTGYTSTVDGSAATSVAEESGIGADHPNVSVTVAYTTTKKPDDPTINPNKPGKDSDMFAHPTRTINVVNPLNGQTDTTKQIVWYGRTKTVSTDPNAKPVYGKWEVGKVDGNKFVADPTASQAWPEYDAPDFTGYTPSQAKVDEATVTPDTKDQTVTITYSDNNGGHVTPTPTPEGTIVIQYVDPNGTIVKTTTISGNEGSSTNPSQSINDNVPDGYHIKDGYEVPTTASFSSTINVPVEKDDSGNHNNDDNNKPSKPSDNGGNKNNGKKNHHYNNNSGIHGENLNGKNNSSYNTNTNVLGQNGNGSLSRLSNNFGQASINENNKSKALPKTGEDDSSMLALAGLSLSLASIFVGLWFQDGKKHRD